MLDVPVPQIVLNEPGVRPLVGLRDRCLILLMFRHGLRVTESCAMRMDQVDLESKILQVQRLKGGLSTTQPLRTEEIRLLKSWMAERERWLRQWRKSGGAGAALVRENCLRGRRQRWSR